MSDIAEIEAHLVRAQAAYDKLPLSGPVTSWCELYGEDLLDSCTKLLAALKQRTELIDAAAGHWLESCRTTSPPIAWEGAIDGAMEAVCKEVERLRARVAELEVQLEQSRSLGKLGGYPCTPEHTWAEWLEDRHKRVAELEAAPSINIAWIGGNCPVQAEGTVGGKPFYFRARGDAWSFGVGADPVGSPDWEITAPFGKDFDAGWMDVEQARSIVLAAAALYSVAQMSSADTPKVAT